MTPYDLVRYPSKAYPRTYPDHLAAIGTLFGMNPAPPDRCRVLEIGCGEGGNLIPMAYSLPGSEFVGIDLAASPIEAGNQVVRELGFHNVELRRLDLQEIDESFGKFDYIIAHGVYAWVPPPIQERLLAVCGDHLNAQGVTFISYNVNPGCRVRSMLREMMLIHARGTSDPIEKLKRGREMLKALIEHSPEQEGVQAFLKAEAEALAERVDGVLFHDELGEYYSPVSFLEFVGAVSRHGLQYLADTPLLKMKGVQLEKEAHQELRRMAQGDPILYQQYMDFLNLRRFRQSLACRSEVTLDRSTSVQAFEKLRVSACVHAAPAADGQAPGTEVFEHISGLKVTTDNPMMHRVFRHLGGIWPESAPFRELLAASGAEEAEELAAVLRRLVPAEFLDLQVTSGLARKAGQRPKASRMAQHEALSRPSVTSLIHRNIELKDDFVRRLLSLLDGTRDRAALVDELATTLPDMPREQLATELERNLEECGRLALLRE